MDGGDPARRVAVLVRREGLTKGYNDVIDTLINAAFEQSVHVVMLIKKMVPQLNPACLFV